MSPLSLLPVRELLLSPLPLREDLLRRWRRFSRRRFLPAASSASRALLLRFPPPFPPLRPLLSRSSMSSSVSLAGEWAVSWKLPAPAPLPPA